MTIGLYVRNGVAYIPTWAKTEAGFYREAEPIEVVDVKATEEFIKKLQKAIATGNPRIPTPDRFGSIKPKVLKYAKVRSLRQFERESAFWTISSENGIYKLTPWKPRPDRGSEEDMDQAERFPPGTALEDVLARVVKVVQSAPVSKTSS